MKRSGGGEFQVDQGFVADAEGLKKARIEFVRLPDLHQNPQALAKAMKKDELYSSTAEIYAIAKQIPGLIEAGREQGRG